MTFRAALSELSYYQRFLFAVLNWFFSGAKDSLYYDMEQARNLYLARFAYEKARYVDFMDHQGHGYCHALLCYDKYLTRCQQLRTTLMRVCLFLVLCLLLAHVVTLTIKLARKHNDDATRALLLDQFGLTPVTATPDQVRRAYRRLMHQLQKAYERGHGDTHFYRAALDLSTKRDLLLTLLAPPPTAASLAAPPEPQTTAAPRETPSQPTILLIAAPPPEPTATQVPGPPLQARHSVALVPTFAHNFVMVFLTFLGRVSVDWLLALLSL